MIRAGTAPQAMLGIQTRTQLARMACTLRTKVLWKTDGVRLAHEPFLVLSLLLTPTVPEQDRFGQEEPMATWPRDLNAGPKGGPSTGPGGGLSTGPGGGASTGPGVGLSIGPGGGMSIGPGGGLQRAQEVGFNRPGRWAVHRPWGWAVHRPWWPTTASPLPA